MLSPEEQAQVKADVDAVLEKHTEAFKARADGDPPEDWIAPLPYDTLVTWLVKV